MKNNNKNNALYLAIGVIIGAGIGFASKKILDRRSESGSSDDEDMAAFMSRRINRFHIPDEMEDLPHEMCDEFYDEDDEYDRDDISPDHDEINLHQDDSDLEKTETSASTMAEITEVTQILNQESEDPQIQQL